MAWSRIGVLDGLGYEAINWIPRYLDLATKMILL
jgi:hypothetical protein